MKRVKFHNGTPIVIVKTGGFAAGVTAVATVGIFAVTALTAVAVADALEEARVKIDNFVGEKTPPKETSKGASKEIVKDTFRTKTKRAFAKSFLKNLFK